MKTTRIIEVKEDGSVQVCSPEGYQIPMHADLMKQIKAAIKQCIDDQETLGKLHALAVYTNESSETILKLNRILDKVKALPTGDPKQELTEKQVEAEAERLWGIYLVIVDPLYRQGWKQVHTKTREAFRAIALETLK